MKYEISGNKIVANNGKKNVVLYEANPTWDQATTKSYLQFKLECYQNCGLTFAEMALFY